MRRRRQAAAVTSGSGGDRRDARGLLHGCGELQDSFDSPRPPFHTIQSSGYHGYYGYPDMISMLDINNRHGYPTCISILDIHLVIHHIHIHTYPKVAMNIHDIQSVRLPDVF